MKYLETAIGKDINRSHKVKVNSLNKQLILGSPKKYISLRTCFYSILFRKSDNKIRKVLLKFVNMGYSQR